MYFRLTRLRPSALLAPAAAIGGALLLAPLALAGGGAPPTSAPTVDLWDTSWVGQPEAWIALLTLTVLEIVLGIDNIIFISILAGKLPEEQRPKARQIGLSLAMGMRIALLLSIAWVMSLTKVLFTMPLAGVPITGQHLVLLVGGLFLLAKATHEIHHSLEGHHGGDDSKGRAGVTFTTVLIQVALLDIVFSLDSVITAVGMAKHIQVMIIAVVIAVGVMMAFAKPLGEFVQRHPTVKMLALSFLLLIGMTLVADGLSFHIPKGYVYFAMGFSVFVEMLNLRIRSKKAKAVHLHRRYEEEGADGGDGPAADAAPASA